MIDGPIIDAHLDLAMNGVQGRDLTLPLAALRRNDPLTGQTATTTFAELRAARVRLCFGTLFACPRGQDFAQGYTDQAGAARQALAQLEQYGRWQDAGWLRLLSTRAEVAQHLSSDDSGDDCVLGVVLLMEGADPIRDADDLEHWVRRGVKVVGPAWQRTRFAGGTGAPGPLTPAGRELVQAMKEQGVTLDASHLDDQAFWDAVAIGPKLIATHANSRALVRGNRQLTDQMAQAIAAADGVIGLVLLNDFIQDGWEVSQPRLPPTELARHAQHFADLIGWERVALGSDLDGGFGNEKTPLGIDAYADLRQFLNVIPPPQRQAVAYGNWARWLTGHL